MRRWTGRLTRRDLGTGVWVLETSAGERCILEGAVPVQLEGSRVTVEGELLEQGMGIGMTGEPMIWVHHVASGGS